MKVKLCLVLIWALLLLNVFAWGCAGREDYKVSDTDKTTVNETVSEEDSAENSSSEQYETGSKEDYVAEPETVTDSEVTEEDVSSQGFSENSEPTAAPTEAYEVELDFSEFE